MPVTPGLPGATVTHGHGVVRGADGRMNVTANLVLRDEQQLGEYRAGWRCLMCHAAQQEAFPTECVEWYCRYPISRRQSEDLAREYEGEHDPWPTHRDQEDPELPGWRKTDSNIVVPKGIRP